MQVVPCDHRSWRWWDRLRRDKEGRKVCNWCGHTWSDAPADEQQYFAAVEERELGTKYKVTEEGRQALERVNRKFENPDCEHVAWRVTNHHKAGDDWREARCCEDCGHCWSVPYHLGEEREAEANAPQTAITAVDYLSGSTLYSVLAHPNATVTVTDGKLSIYHHEPVSGIVAVRPMVINAAPERLSSDTESEDR